MNILHAIISLTLLVVAVIAVTAGTPLLTPLVLVVRGFKRLVGS